MYSAYQVSGFSLFAFLLIIGQEYAVVVDLGVLPSAYSSQPVFIEVYITFIPNSYAISLRPLRCTVLGYAV